MLSEDLQPCGHITELCIHFDIIVVDQSTYLHETLHTGTEPTQTSLRRQAIAFKFNSDHIYMYIHNCILNSLQYENTLCFKTS